MVFFEDFYSGFQFFQCLTIFRSNGECVHS